METISKKHLEKGYGMFPYLVVRWFPTIYQQIPIHRMPCAEHLEGIFIREEDEKAMGYPEVLFQLLRRVWEEHVRAGKPSELCLVLDERTAFYIGKEGNIATNKPPYGGVLLDVYGRDHILWNGRHYVELQG